MGLGLSVCPTVKETGPLAENWRLLHGGRGAFVVGTLQSREKTRRRTCRGDTKLTATGLAR